MRVPRANHPLTGAPPLREGRLHRMCPLREAPSWAQISDRAPGLGRETFGHHSHLAG